MIKLYRDEPEFPGAPLTAEVPEESLQMAIDNGWKVAEKKVEPKVEPKKPEVAPKVEEPKEEKPKAAKKKLD